MTNDIPRRAQLEKLVAAELAIRAAVHAVEEMGADVRLTDAVIFLELARNCVGDFVDKSKERTGPRYFSGETAEMIAKWIEGYGAEPIDSKLAAAAIRNNRWLP